MRAAIRRTFAPSFGSGGGARAGGVRAVRDAARHHEPLAARRKYAFARGRKRKKAITARNNACIISSPGEWKILRITWKAIQAMASQRAQFCWRSIQTPPISAARL